MRLNVFSQTLAEVRRSLLHWSLLSACVTWLFLSVHPLLLLLTGDALSSYTLPDWLSWLLTGEAANIAQLQDMNVWVGQIGLGLILPALLSVYSIHWGSWLVAGEEERGSLGLLLAAPVQRYRLVIEKFAVLFLLVIGPSLGVWVSLLIAGALSVFRMGTIMLSSTGLNLFMLGMAFGTLALAAGSLTGRWRLSRNLSLVFALVSLLFSRLPPVPAGRLLHWISPFHYYQQALTAPFLSAYLLVLTGLVIAGLALAWIAFERRDLAV